MGASKEISEQEYQYTSIMMGGNLVIMWLFIINAVFRSAGDATISLRVLFLANGLNLILGPLFFLGLDQYRNGELNKRPLPLPWEEGWPLFISFFLLYRGSTRVKVRPGDMKPVPSVAMKLIRHSA